MPNAYKVLSAENEKRLPAKDDRPELAVHKYQLEGVDKPVERVAKLTTPLPAVGSMIELELEESRWGLRGKVPARNFNGGGFRKRDPNESRRIERQHSQNMALDYIRIKASIGGLPEGMDGKQGFDLSDVWKLADAFDADLDGKPEGKSELGEWVDDGGLPPA